MSQPKLLNHLLCVLNDNHIDYMVTGSIVSSLQGEPRATHDEENVFGFKMNISKPEDTILAKLRWAKLSGGSEKQFTDAMRVYEIQYGILDLSYL
jgi:hypothetical protein